MERRNGENSARAVRVLLRVAGVLLAAVAAFIILSALRPSSASAAANPGEDDSSLLSLTEAVTAPVVAAAAPVVGPVVAAAAPVVEPVVAAAAPVVEPVVAAAAPVVRAVVEPVAPVVGSVVAPVVAAAAPVVDPVVASAAPVVRAVVEPVAPVVESVVAAAASAVAPVVEVLDPAVAAAPVVDAVNARVAMAVESAMARVQIVVDRVVRTVELLGALDTVIDVVDTVVGLVDRVATSVPEVPPLSEVVGNLLPGLDPVVELPSVPEPTIVTPSPLTRMSQPDESAIVPEVVSELPSLVSTPDAAITVHADFFLRPAPSDLSSAMLSDLMSLEKPPVGDAPRATPSLEFDLRVAEKISGGPLTWPAPATTLPATQGPTPASSGSGGDLLARSHAVVPSSAHCVNWLSRGVTTDVSWMSALFVLSIECPG